MTALKTPARMALVTFVVALTVAVCTFFATDANAAVLSKSVSSSISSAAVQDGNVYWFQRDPFAPSDPEDPGAVYARSLGTSRVVRAYAPPRGFIINAFNVRAGRVAVGIAPREEEWGKTAIVELKPTPGGFSSSEVVSRVAVVEGASCGSLVELVNIDQAGAVIYEDISFEGMQGKCEVVRRSGVFRSVTASGTTDELSSRKSGWALGGDDARPGSLKSGPGDWAVLLNTAVGLSGEQLGTFNVRSGERHPFSVQLSSESVEFAPSGQTLLGPFGDGSAYTLGADPKNPTAGVRLARPRSIVWMHFCGSQILEISRRKGTRKRSPGGMWNLYIRDANGTVTNRVPRRLHRGTVFDTCNADVAVFHRGLRKGRNRQFSVALGG